MSILTTKELAKRWDCTTQAITERCRTGSLHYIKNAPKYRFSLEYIKEIEEVDLNPLSPFQRRKLEREIENLKKIIAEKDNYIREFKSLALKQI